jgi:hypothetical protein
MRILKKLTRIRNTGFRRATSPLTTPAPATTTATTTPQPATTTRNHRDSIVEHVRTCSIKMKRVRNTGRATFNLQLHLSITLRCCTGDVYGTHGAGGRPHGPYDDGHGRHARQPSQTYQKRCCQVAAVTATCLRCCSFEKLNDRENVWPSK